MENSFQMLKKIGFKMSFQLKPQKAILSPGKYKIWNFSKRFTKEFKEETRKIKKRVRTNEFGRVIKKLSS
jgi:hypothetical protein